MKTIQLQGKEDTQTIVDDKDFEELNKHQWFIIRSGKKRHPYVARRIKNQEGKFIYEIMARKILSISRPFYALHKNGNHLDNRRENLLIVNHAQIMQAKKDPYCNNKLETKGVWMNKRKTKYISQIMVERTHIYLGSFFSKEEAEKAYKEATEKYFEILTKIRP